LQQSNLLEYCFLEHHSFIRNFLIAFHNTAGILLKPFHLQESFLENQLRMVLSKIWPEPPQVGQKLIAFLLKWYS
jgi:hypothetical protein